MPIPRSNEADAVDGRNRSALIDNGRIAGRLAGPRSVQVRRRRCYPAGFARALDAVYHSASGYSIQGVKFLSWDDSPFDAGVSSVHGEIC